MSTNSPRRRVTDDQALQQLPAEIRQALVFGPFEYDAYSVLRLLKQHRKDHPGIQEPLRVQIFLYMLRQWDLQSMAPKRGAPYSSYHTCGIDPLGW